jgi:hypothetical protein
MAQVTIYLPDGIEKEARRRAKRARKSLSAFFAGLVLGDRRAKQWPRSFRALFGACDLPDIERLPADERDPL